MKTVKTLLILFSFFSCVFAGFARAEDKLPPASIGVSPTRVELTVQHKTTTGSVAVINLSSQPVDISSSLVNFDLDENNNFRELPPEAGSLSTAIMLNPVNFTIPPHGSQTVRFAITPERLSGTGEHRAMLFLSELVDTNQAAVKLNFRLGVPIYAQLGEVEQKVQLHNAGFSADETLLEFDISALGNTQVRPTGYYLWWPADEFPEEGKAYNKLRALADDANKTPPAETTGGKLVTKPVFPGTRRLVTARLTLPAHPGDYVLVVQMKAGSQSFERTIRRPESPIYVVESN